MSWHLASYDQLADISCDDIAAPLEWRFEAAAELKRRAGLSHIP